jgi:hypothetical protein
MPSPLRCHFHTFPAPDGAGYVGSFEVVDADGRALASGRDIVARPRMQDALDHVWPMGREALAALDESIRRS